MKPMLLKESIELLKSIRSELHGVIDDSALDQLEILIVNLEAEYSVGKNNISSQEILFLLGEVMKNLPLVIDIMNKWSDS